MESPEYHVEALLDNYIEAARILHEAGTTNLYLAKGPLMNTNVDLGHLHVLETMDLPNHFGSNTKVVTRGTYNLGWEAIASGSTLITTERSATTFEYVNNRNQYLSDQGYAYAAEMNGRAIANAVLQERPKHLSEISTALNTSTALENIKVILSKLL